MLVSHETHTPEVDVVPINVLVVEDCTSDVVLLEHMLIDASSDAAYRFTAVPCLIDAFVLLDKERFDVVLLDLNLLDIEGVSSVSALHAAEPYIPIIVYSGTEDPKVKNACFALGAKHYVVKGHESGHSLKFMIDHILKRVPTA